MKKEITLKIVFDTDNDEFGINKEYVGFDEKTPVQNSLLIASILGVAKQQELAIFKSK